MAETAKTEPQSPTQPEPEKMDRAQLIQAVVKQVEYYFSKENLQSDAFLTSQMDANMSVAISVVMKFGKVKQLTQDEALFREALAASSLTVLDNNRIKANLKTGGRSTIILREIPSDAPIEEVKEIFNFVGCKPIGSVKSEIGDMWYIVMENEQDAKDTILDLRMKKRTFRGASIKSRLKTESVVRSFYPVQQQQQTSVLQQPMYGTPQMMTAGPYGGAPMDMRAFGYAMPGMPAGVVPMGAMPMPQLNADGSLAMPVNMGAAGGAAAAVGPDATAKKESSTSATANDESGAEGKAKGGHAKDASGSKSGNSTANAKGNNSKNNNSSSNNNSTTDRRRDNNANNNSSGNNNSKDGARKGGADKSDSLGGGNKKGGNKGGASDAPQPVIDLGAANFPPLGAVDDTPVPTPGYKGDFQKYSFEDIIAIVKNVKEAVLPAGLNPLDHGYSMNSTVNEDLLKRQRTFSIDETREQLQQGRPIHRQGVIAGNVDYRSLMFGDDGMALPAGQQTGTAASAAANQQQQHQHSKESQSDRRPSTSGDAAAAGHKNEHANNNKKNSSSSSSAPSSSGGGSWAAMARSAAAAVEFVPASAAAATKPVQPRTGSASAAKPAVSASNDKDSKKGNSSSSQQAKRGNNNSSSSSNNNSNTKDPKSPGGDKRKAGAAGRRGSNKDNEDNMTADDGTSESNSSSSGAKNTTSSAQTPVTWGGKASFANVLKNPNATPAAPAMSALSGSSSSSGNNAEQQVSSPGAPPLVELKKEKTAEKKETATVVAPPAAPKGPLSFAERAAAAAALPSPPPAGNAAPKQAPKSSATTGTTAPRRDNNNNKSSTDNRRPRSGSGSGSTNKATSTAGGKGTDGNVAEKGNFGNADNGANSSGMWVKATLPPAPITRPTENK